MNKPHELFRMIEAYSVNWALYLLSQKIHVVVCQIIYFRVDLLGQYTTIVFSQHGWYSEIQCRWETLWGLCALSHTNPGAILAKMISDTWEKEPENPIFIDWDGDVFVIELLALWKHWAAHFHHPYNVSTWIGVLRYFSTKWYCDRD